MPLGVDVSAGRLLLREDHLRQQHARTLSSFPDRARGVAVPEVGVGQVGERRIARNC